MNKNRPIRMRSIRRSMCWDSAALYIKRRWESAAGCKLPSNKKFVETESVIKDGHEVAFFPKTK